MFVIFLILFFIVILYLYIEFLIVSRAVNNIPIRILVNGTRGKTTAVKILYNILKNSNYTVCARTTGEQPIEYYPDGQKRFLNRFAPASIIENINLIRKWNRMNPDAIILECMALHPENQFVLSKKMFKPTHILITNIFQDHFEVMGECIEKISETIKESFFEHAKIILSEKSKISGIHDFDYNFVKDNSFKYSYNNIPESIINESWNLISELCEDLKLDKKITENEFHKIWKLNNE